MLLPGPVEWIQAAPAEAAASPGWGERGGEHRAPWTQELPRNELHCWHSLPHSPAVLQAQPPQSALLEGPFLQQSRTWPVAPCVSACELAQATCPWGYQDCLVAVRVQKGVREPPWDVHAHTSLPGTQGTAAALRSAGRTWALGSRGICYLGIAAIAWGKPPAACSVSLA